MIRNGITGSPCSRFNPAKLNHSVSSANPRLRRAIYSPAETRPGAGVALQILFMAFFCSAHRFVSSCVTQLQVASFYAVAFQMFFRINFILLLVASCPFPHVAPVWFPKNLHPWPFQLCIVVIRCVHVHAFHPHLEKKQRWPADELSPSYESLCLRLSGGLLWLCPSLGAEISMLLLLSLLLELRPGLESPCSPELSWEEGKGESQQLSSFAHSTKTAIKLTFSEFNAQRSPNNKYPKAFPELDASCIFTQTEQGRLRWCSGLIFQNKSSEKIVFYCVKSPKVVNKHGWCRTLKNKMGAIRGGFCASGSDFFFFFGLGGGQDVL